MEPVITAATVRILAKMDRFMIGTNDSGSTFVAQAMVGCYNRGCMSTRFNKAYLLVPVIYIGVIFGLLFLQFSGGERFSRTLGPLALRATRNATSEAGEPTVRGLDIEFNGLAFEFQDESGLVVETADQLLEVPVHGFTQDDSGFLVEFAGGFLLSFAAAEDPVPEVQLTLTVPDSTITIGETSFESSEILEITVPFRFVGNAVPDSSDRASFVTVARGEDEFFFSAPPDALIDPVNEKILLKPAASGRSVRYVEAVAGNPSTVLGWFAGGAHDMSTAEYERAVAAYVNAAYAGWTSSRYNASSLTWVGPDGSAEFSEATLVAYLAEAWARDDYDRAFAEMRRAPDLHPGSLGLLSSVYLGHLTEVSSALGATDAALSAEIRLDIEEGRTTVFRRPELFLFAADRGETGLYDSLLEYASQVDLRSVDVTTAVGMLANHILAQHPNDSSRLATERFVELVDTLLLGSVAQTEGKFFLQSAPGQIDVALSAGAGMAIAELGGQRNDPALVAVGRNLVVSVLEIADQFGMIPASLVIRGSSLEANDGFIAPEVIYPIIAQNPAYPHAVSLSDEIGTGAWAWTAVGLRPTRIAESEWRITLDYPRLRTHFVMIRGVPVFDRLELFGQTWRNAPDFEIYSKGRNYDPESETLMIKYYDDSVQRDLVIYY
jgi:hypothetical protein